MKALLKTLPILAILSFGLVSCGGDDDKTKVTSVSLSETTLSLTVGQMKILTETVLPADADDKSVKWTSSDNSIATVDSGKVMAKSKGTATITVATNDGNYKASCVVTVEEIVVPQDPVITVLFGDKEWTASDYIAVEYASGNLPHINILAAKTEFDSLPFIDIIVPNKMGTETLARDIQFYYYEDGALSNEDGTTLYGDWWLLQGEVTVTKYENNKLSGYVGSYMYDVLDYQNGNDSAEVRSLFILFSNLDVYPSDSKVSPMLKK